MCNKHLSKVLKVINLVKRHVPKRLKRNLKRTAQNFWDSKQYRRLYKPLPSKKAAWVVFICKGNVCRSAFAEHYLREKSSNSFKVESCGLDVDQGGPPPENAVRVAAKHGVDLQAHQSKGISSCNMERADLILAMEFWQYCRLLSLLPEKSDQIFLLRDFVPGLSGCLCNISDPYGLSDKEFDKCFRLMQKALDHLCIKLGIR